MLEKRNPVTFHKHSGHCYSVRNQNALNQALYDYFGNDCNKKSVRAMVQDWPTIYPITIVIIDLSFECSRVHLECFRMDEEAHSAGFNDVYWS